MVLGELVPKTVALQTLKSLRPTRPNPAFKSQNSKLTRPRKSASSLGDAVDSEATAGGEKTSRGERTADLILHLSRGGGSRNWGETIGVLVLRGSYSLGDL